MARYSEFYKGKRKKRNVALVPFAVLLGIISFLVVSFYGMQKYAVISKDGVEVKLPMLADEDTVLDSQGNEIRQFETVETEIVFDAPDYSRVKATAGENLSQMRAIFVPYENLTEEKLDEYASRLKVGNALVLEMKPRTGQLMWNSGSQAAIDYGLYTANATTEALPALISSLKEENGIYLVAQISCCIDNIYASRSTTVALRTSYGANYTDDEGTWLDPYNAELRTYVVEMVKELYAMGFDEVVLADVAHPVIEQTEENSVSLVYTREMSTTPSPVNAVCGFALSVAEQLRDRDGVLSIYVNSATALVKADEANGQDATLFMKLYDRVYYPTERAIYSYNVEDIERSVTIGDVPSRFVPVLVNLLPENSETMSWVLVDQEED